MSDKRTLIKNARMPDDFSRRFAVRDLLLCENERGEMLIERIAENISTPAGQEIDARSLTLIPAFTDLCPRLCEPGAEHRETIASGTLAASLGGYSALLASPDTSPMPDDPGVLDRMSAAIRTRAHCRVFLCASLTDGHSLPDCDLLAAHGARAFALPDNVEASDPVLRAAMLRCAEGDHLVISRNRRTRDYPQAGINEGRISHILGIRGIPASAEALSIARTLILSRETGCRVHIMNVSTALGVEMIAEAKSKGIKVSASTAPPYFSFTEDELLFYGARAVLDPPLRAAGDVEAVIRALADGTLDCITSSHTPLTPAEKGHSFKDARPGTLGLQTTFSAAVTYLLAPGHIDLYRLSELFSLAPARILGQETALGEGAPANFNLVDLDREYIVSDNYLRSKSRNSLYTGLNLRGVIALPYITTGY